MPSTHFDLTSHWRIPAPVDRVWAALTDPEGWPGWWSYVRAVRTLREGDPSGVGSIRRIEWSTRLPYEIVIEVEAVEALRHERLRGRARGQLRGEGTWLLRAAGDRTDVTYVWRVELAKPWMRWLAPVLAPVFRWNHNGVMRAGEAGLTRHLAGLPGGPGRRTSSHADGR
jgi:carbon monoxide dehydrogenase subunit G